MNRTGSPRFVVPTFVKAGRDADFETFLRDVVVPAEARARPHQVGMWQLLRPAADQPEGATRAYVLTFYGPSSLDEWDLQPLFDDAYGADKSREYLTYFEDMLEGEQVVYALDEEPVL